ncbi:MAG: leucine-rich repeat domain-containing protein, partial [Myxococcales bacterium]|nr:leucine-rich repeat domain-containing protein [Myxococcales bacterium]
ALIGLNLDFTKTTDLTPIAGLTSLKTLWLNNTQVSDSEAKKLQAALPNLTLIR